jgi:hypothetical protein
MKQFPGGLDAIVSAKTTTTTTPAVLVETVHSIDDEVNKQPELSRDESPSSPTINTATDAATNNTPCGMASEIKSISSSINIPLNTTNGTTAATASTFSYSAYKIIKESKANRKAALATAAKLPAGVAPEKANEPDLQLPKNGNLDDSMSPTLSSKVSFNIEDNVRYYKLSKEERDHKRSSSYRVSALPKMKCENSRKFLQRSTWMAWNPSA